MATKRQIVRKSTRPTAAQWQRHQAVARELRAKLRAGTRRIAALERDLELRTRERDAVERVNDRLVELGEGRVPYPSDRKSPENYFDAADRHDFVARQAVAGGTCGV